MRNLQPAMQDLFPALKEYMKLLLVNPASSATTEHSFSSLRRLKTWLRNSMGHTRLNSCAVCSLHVEVLDGTDICRRLYFSCWSAWKLVWEISSVMISQSVDGRVDLLFVACNFLEWMCMYCVVYIWYYLHTAGNRRRRMGREVTKGKTRCVPSPPPLKSWLRPWSEGPIAYWLHQIHIAVENKLTLMAPRSDIKWQD